MKLPLCALMVKKDGLWSSPKNISGDCPKLVSQEINFAWTPDQATTPVWGPKPSSKEGGHDWSKTTIKRSSGKESTIIMPTKNSIPLQPVVKSVNGIKPDSSGNIEQSMFDFWGFHYYGSYSLEWIVDKNFDIRHQISAPLNLGPTIIRVITHDCTYIKARLVREPLSGQPDYNNPVYGESVLDDGVCSFFIDSSMPDTKAIGLYFLSADDQPHQLNADVEIYTQIEEAAT